MEASTARRLAHGMWFGTLAIWLGAVILVLATSPSDAISAALLGLPIATYGSVGADQVHLGSDDEAIRFTIHDDGPGFEVSTTDAGEGMQIMRDRIAALSGELAIESTPGRGTTVTGRVPARAMETSPA
jgi:signal transduction histidine kinase